MDDPCDILAYEISIAQGYDNGLRGLTRPQVSRWPLVITGTEGIKSDPGCCGDTDTDIALGNSVGLGDTMALGGSIGHSGKHGSCGSMALGYQHGPMSWTRPETLVRSLVLTGAKDINKDPGYSSDTNLDMVLSCSLHLDVTMAQGAI